MSLSTLHRADDDACEEAILLLVEGGLTRVQAEQEHATQMRHEIVLGPTLATAEAFASVRRHKLS